MNENENICSKKDRIKMLDISMTGILQLSKLYRPSSPAWILLQAAYGHIKSINYLESEINFNDEILGVIFNEI